MILATAGILIGGVYIASATSSNTSQVTTSKNAKAETLDPTSYDWGNIPYGGGTVTKTFTIKNTGKDTLKLFNAHTSCHCTSVSITTPTDQSPAFKMDSVASWVGQVAPGKTAKVVVIFDPAFHGPQGIGPVTRYVSVSTNDASEQQLTFTLTGTVIK